MKTGAVIAEFNPFHTGHKLLIDAIRKECDCVIAIMSGNFVQRGECAIFSKAERTRMALCCGVDLVLELPCVYALSSAEGFSDGAVKTLDALHTADYLYFGSECGDINLLSAAADALNNEAPEFKVVLSKKLGEGLSFPAARQLALQAVLPEADILETPNNILAIEYIRSLKKLSSSIVPRTIRRVGSGYNDTEITSSVASASALRALLEKGNKIDSFTPCTAKEAPLFMTAFDALIAARVKSASTDELLTVPDCNYELAVRIIEASRFNTFSEIVDAVSCKSYTQSRIRRILCNLLIGNRFTSLPEPCYIRPLGFNETGSELLRKIKSTASQQIVARGALLKDNPIFSLECKATDIYNLARGKMSGEEFTFSPHSEPAL